VPQVPTRDFALDRFQQEAVDAFDRGESVLVSAPTGAGKTVIAEHAIEAMLTHKQRMFYTSPIKALANQKFRDFGRRYGAENVGLLTGDLTIRPEAAIVVMTTEVLRNMLYEGAGRVRDLGCVVLDEVHYLQDPQRGPVWEEVLLNLPREVRTVSLSATVSNVDEFVDWLETVRGPTQLIEERTRPVPLRHEFAATHKESRYIERVPLLKGSRISVQAEKFRPERKKKRHPGGNKSRDERRRRGGRDRRSTSPWAPPRRTELVDDLVADEVGPIIWFIFSRAGCDEAVEQCRRAGLRYTTDDEADELAQILHDATSEIDDDDWYSLALDDWQESFEAGIASHHAGLIPAVKEAVEKAFARGLISAVFATETLALGVNLPARTVVIERLVKYNGESHEMLTPLEFTQLAGRAGRRGLDAEGTAISCWSNRVNVADIAALAASTDFPLRSAFSPNYNMVANLIRRADQETARRFVGRSFAQFQRDRTVVAAESRNEKLRDQIQAAQSDMHCDHGDVLAWLARDKTQARAGDEELGQLRPGAVLAHGTGVIVVSVAHRGGGVVVRTIDRSGHLATHRSGDLASPINVMGVEKLPAGLSPASREAAAWVRQQLDSHWDISNDGVGSCEDLHRHLAAVKEVERLERKLGKVRAKNDRRSGALVAEFDAVAEILHDRGFADDWFLNAKGNILTSVHGEAEAVLAEALEAGVLSGLDGIELAAVLSSLVYETRGTSQGGSFRWPSKRVRQATIRLQQIAGAFRNLEQVRLSQFLTREPDPGLVETVYGWASGQGLDDVLDDEVTGGDFVRSMRQVVDICRQVASIAQGELSEAAADAVYRVDRGVVRSARDLTSNDDSDADDAEALHGDRVIVDTSDDSDGDEPEDADAAVADGSLAHLNDDAD